MSEYVTIVKEVGALGIAIYLLVEFRKTMDKLCLVIEGCKYRE